MIIPRARRRWGVRKRAVLAAASVVLVALIGGGIILLFLLREGLIASAEASTLASARVLAQQYSTTPLPPARTLMKNLARNAQAVQIVSPDGSVIGASSRELLAYSLIDALPSAGQRISQHVNNLNLVDNQAGVVLSAVGFTNSGRSYAVVVVADVDVEQATVQLVALYLFAGTPVLLVVVVAMTWYLVGRSLRPVDRIGEQVDGISRLKLDQRLDVPPTNDEIARLALTMNRMLGRLEVADGNQRAFVADASHELRSPLSTINATLEIAIADTSDQTWRDMQGVLVSQTERMQRLVDDLLTLAKADDQGVRIRSTEQDLDDLIESEVAQLRRTTDHAMNVSAEPIRLICDGPRISQVLRNLLDNADRYAESAIAVTARMADGFAIVDVDNDGPVIELNDRSRIFDRFVRIDSSRSRDSGNSGLGLAITSELIKAHGGTVIATQSPVGWCRFEFTLPLS